MDQNRPEVLIKRYGGTRLYDTATLSCVRLADLADMVISGQRFIVCDATSGEDITRDVLKRLHPPRRHNSN